MLATILVNGVASDLMPADNRGLHYGDGVFETILCSNGVPAFWPLHWARLQKGADQLDLLLKPERYYIECILEAAAQFELAVVKLSVIRTGVERGYCPFPQTTSLDIVYAYPTSWEALKFQQPLALWLCATTLPEDRSLVGIKHLNRLHQVMAAAECYKAGYEDGVVLNTAQIVLETTSANLMFIGNNVLYTPNLNTAGLFGIGATVVAAAWQKQGGQLEIDNYTVAQLCAAELVISINCVRGVRQVKQIYNEQNLLAEWPLQTANLELLQNLFFTELIRSWQDGSAA